MQYFPEQDDPPEGFDWDLQKAIINREKHRIGFRDATLVFLDERRVDEDSSRPEHGEARRKSTGMVRGRLMSLVYTFRGDQRRIFSASWVRRDERRKYGQGETLP
jgi:uncharacterized DUF497 family protein